MVPPKSCEAAPPYRVREIVTINSKLQASFREFTRAHHVVNDRSTNECLLLLLLWSSFGAIVFFKSSLGEFVGGLPGEKRS